MRKFILSRVLCVMLPGIVRVQSCCSGPRSMSAPVCKHLESSFFRRAASPAQGLISCFYSRSSSCRNIDFCLLVTSRVRSVTLALHARNAKKIFAESPSAISIISRVMACNVGKNASVFPENTRISCAVCRSIDRLMLSKTRTTDSPRSPSVSVIAPARTRGQSVLLCRASSGGAS